MDILQQIKYYHILHFVLSAEQPKKMFSIMQNDTKVQLTNLDQLKKSNSEVLGFSEIIKNHKLTEFTRVYSFNLDSSSEVLMFSKDEVEQSEFFNVLVLIGHNPNLNLVVDNVVKKLKKINKFKNITFSLATHDSATTYSIDLSDGKVEFKKNKYRESKIEVIKKGELISKNKIIKYIFIFFLLLISSYLSNTYIRESAWNGIIMLIITTALSYILEKLLTFITILRKEGKYNNTYFVLNTNYNFREKLNYEANSDPNMVYKELQTPEEEDE